MIGNEPAPLFYDCHIHLVGNGAAGSGCWIRLGGWHRMMGSLLESNHRADGGEVGCDALIERCLAGCLKGE